MAYSNVITVGDQVIRGVKTFTDAPVFSSGVTDSTIVRTTGTQTVAGVKTFSDTTASTSTTTGGAIFGGGVGVAGTLWGNEIFSAGQPMLTLIGDNSTQSIGTGSPVLLTSAVWKTGTTYGTGISSSGGIITVANAGYYLISVSGVYFQANATGHRAMWVTTAGGTRYGNVQLGAGSSTQQHAQTISSVAYLAAGTTLQVQVFQDSGSTLTVTVVNGGYSFFTVLRIF